MKTAYARIVIKIGSNVLTRNDGTLDITRMSALTDQIASILHQGIEVILVSSGAVAAGRSEMYPKRKLDNIAQRQLFSAVGQAKLINRYYELFREHGITVGQVLTTKESFSTRQHYLNQRTCMEVMLQNGILPIVNENDTIALTELMFTDNDELSGLIAAMMNAQALILLSNIDGVFSGIPSDPESFLLREINPKDNLTEYIQQEKSGFGRGGMITKTRISRQIAAEGINVWIANGKRENILTMLLNNPQDTPCTHFKAAKVPTSSIKKWIAHSQDFCKGSLFINKEVTLRLLSGQVISILPVGITNIEGDFEKDDLVHIFGSDETEIGIGKTDYPAIAVQAVMGCKEKKAIVHYDFLYIK